MFGFGDIYQKFQVELPGEKRSEDVCFQHSFSIGAWFEYFHLRTTHLSLLKGNVHVLPLISPYKTLTNFMYKPYRSNYALSSLLFSFSFQLPLCPSG